LLFALAAAAFLVHFLDNAFFAYGYFRDELYYIACSEHLAWGYVDQPPLSIALLAASRFAFGDALPFLRLLPALAGVATVLLAGLMARELGGGRFAQFWGPGKITGEVLIIVGGDLQDHLEEFASCELAVTRSHTYARSFETDLPVWVCRGLRAPVAEVWPHTREFI
jgi:hypothetical protein